MEEHSQSCDVCAAIANHQDSGLPGPTKPEEVRAHHVSAIVRNERQIVEDLKRTQDKVADKITDFAGSLDFVYIHTVWFGIWIVVNAGLFSAGVVFDKFPYGLLTMIVSLEAIFLSTFVMVSQNRQAGRADLRAELDYETNIRSEVWSLHIGQKLGVDVDHVEQAVAALIAKARKV